VSVLGIIPTYLRTHEDLALTLDALVSWQNTTGYSELIVVDDCSPNKELYDKLCVIANDRNVEVWRMEANGGFAKTVNVGLRRARAGGQDDCLVNADIMFHKPCWLDPMIENDADVVGALLVYPNGLVQHAGIFFSVITRRFDHIHRMAPSTLAAAHEPRICPVTGALMLIKHHVLGKVGLFDENFAFGFEDVDYCHEVFKAGLKCAYEPRAQAIHHESMFRSQDPSGDIQKKWWASWNYLHQKHAGHGFADYVPTLIWDDVANEEADSLPR
jgi:GT2 family glycosyltransferase